MRGTNAGYGLVDTALVVALLAVMSGISVPRIAESRIRANEVSAVASMIAIANAQLAFQAAAIEPSLFGEGQFGTLSALGQASSSPFGGAPVDGAPFIDEALASGVKDGYSFIATPVHYAGEVSLYTATALPIELGKTGLRGFFLNESGLIRFSTGGELPSVVYPPLTRAAPSYLEPRIRANEESAVAGIRAIANAEALFRAMGINEISGVASYGSLADLGAGTSPFLDPSLASGRHNGYDFIATYSTFNGQSYYYATAIPSEYDRTGERAFFVDETGIIRYEDEGFFPNSTSPPLD